MNYKTLWSSHRLTFVSLVVVVVLLVIALLAPLTANWIFGVFKPTAESGGVWFQRSGAVMTVFALLASTLQADAMGRLWPQALLGDLGNRDALAFVKGKFRVCQNVSFLFTAIGTVIWGYGDVLVAGAVQAICSG